MTTTIKEIGESLGIANHPDFTDGTEQDRLYMILHRVQFLDDYIQAAQARHTAVIQALGSLDKTEFPVYHYPTTSEIRSQPKRS